VVELSRILNSSKVYHSVSQLQDGAGSMPAAG